MMEIVPAFTQSYQCYKSIIATEIVGHKWLFAKDMGEGIDSLYAMK